MSEALQVKASLMEENLKRKSPDLGFFKQLQQRSGVYLYNLVARGSIEG